MFLVKSSYCFLLSSICSFIKCRFIFGFLFGFLFITSYIHHYYGAYLNNYPLKSFAYIISTSDKLLAHIITLKSLNKYSIISIIYITLVYYFIIKHRVKPYLSNKFYFWHSSIHVVSNLFFIKYIMYNTS
jgi:hypothetical protein